MFDEEDLKATLETIKHANENALENAGNSTEIEQALIRAVQARVPQGLDELAFRACNEAYAEAMSLVYKRFPQDLDIASLYADSLYVRPGYNTTVLS
jgi:hypothetical protein